MTSTNSSNKFIKALKNNFRRGATVFVVFQIFAVMLSVCFISMNTGFETDAEGAYDVTQDLIRGLQFFAAFCVFEAFIVVASMFRGIYRKRASDFYFSLPVKRGSWFNANFVFGAVSIAVSYVILYICSVLVFKLHIIKASAMFTIDAGEFLKYILLSFVAVVVIYTIFIMCACVSGRMWQYIFLCCITSVALYIGTIGFICYLNTIHGSWINLDKAYVVSALELVFKNPMGIKTSEFFIAAAVQFVVAYVAGYFSFKTRKAEVAENKLSGRLLPVIITAICFLAEIFICLGIAEAALYSRIIAAVIMVVITAVILSAIFFRKAMSKPVIASLLGAAVISVAVIFSVQVIPEKTYINYIPESSEVETVTVYDYGYIGSPSITDLLYGAEYLNTSDYNPETYYNNVETYVFSTDDGKEKLNQLHKKIVAKETRDTLYAAENFEFGYETIKLEYKLKSGKTIKRTYTVSSHEIYKEYVSLFQTDEGFEQIDDFNINPDEIKFAEVLFDEDVVSGDGYAYIGTETDDISAHIDEYKKLYQCIRTDLQNASPERIVRKFGNFFIRGLYLEEAVPENMDECIEIHLYMINDDISEEQKEKLQNMLTYSEIDSYNLSYLESQGFFGTAVIREYDYWIAYEDENTISYLKELGYKINS